MSSQGTPPAASPMAPGATPDATCLLRVSPGSAVIDLVVAWVMKFGNS